jgi:hypothetical protein
MSKEERNRKAVHDFARLAKVNDPNRLLPLLEEKLKVVQSEECILKDKIGDLRAVLRRPEIEKKVGRFYRYMNSYNGKDTWPMYVKVVGLSKDALYEFVVLKYEKLIDDRIVIEYEPLRDSLLVSEISEAEFKKGVAAILKELRAVDKGVFDGR